MKRVISKHHTREWVDVFYTLVYSEATLLPTYLGHTGTTIHYDEDNQVTGVATSHRSQTSLI